MAAGVPGQVERAPSARPDIEPRPVLDDAVDREVEHRGRLAGSRDRQPENARAAGMVVVVVRE